MRSPRLRPAPLLAAAALLLGSADPAAAQIILGRGHVVIGGPVDFSVSTGHGNYPGGDGFVPGYGYYPQGWIDSGVDVGLVRLPPYLRPAPPDVVLVPPPPPPPAPALTLPDGAALLAVRVPADAEVWFDGEATAQRGRTRLFVTPPLDGGREWTYSLRVRWRDGGRPVERAQTFRVRPGDRLLIDYLGDGPTTDAAPGPFPGAAGAADEKGKDDRLK
jgi:uncharacterized protein (TIGR03000 family)